MSIWTTLTGSITLDYLRLSEKQPELETAVQKCFGKYEDMWFGQEFFECYPDSLDNMAGYGISNGLTVPEGSEGSLSYRFFRIGHKNAMNCGLVTIWGNLRSYEKQDVEEKMIPYFAKVFLGLHLAHISVHIATIKIRSREHGWLLSYENGKFTSEYFVLKEEEAL